MRREERVIHLLATVHRSAGASPAVAKNRVNTFKTVAPENGFNRFRAIRGKPLKRFSCLAGLPTAGASPAVAKKTVNTFKTVAPEYGFNRFRRIGENR